MASILIQFAHPTYQTSRANKAMIAALTGLENVTIRDLYEIYPDFHIDVDVEKSLLETHDVIVLQHPFQWYSCPALMKEWIDVTLEHGWAYGPNADALKGKKMMSAITTGGPTTAYARDGNNTYSIPELLSPFDQTARLCQMTYLEPFLFNGSKRATEAEITANAESYRDRIVGLRDNHPSQVFTPFFERGA